MNNLNFLIFKYLYPHPPIQINIVPNDENVDPNSTILKFFMTVYNAYILFRNKI